MTESKMVRRETGAPLTEPQEKKLNAIAKMIEFAITGKGVRFILEISKVRTGSSVVYKCLFKISGSSRIMLSSFSFCDKNELFEK